MSIPLVAIELYMKHFPTTVFAAFIAMGWFLPATVGTAQPLPQQQGDRIPQLLLQDFEMPPQRIPPGGTKIPPRAFQDFDWKGDPEAILKQQLRHVEYWRNVMKLLNDPQGNFGDIDIDNLPNINLDPATISSLKKMVDGMKPGANINAKKVEQFKKALEKAEVANKLKQANVNPQPNGQQPTTPLKLPEPPEPTVEDRFNEWLEEMAYEIAESDFGQTLVQSDAWRDTMEEMQMSLLNADGALGDTDWQSMVGNLPFTPDVDFSFLEDGLAPFADMETPEMPDWGVPSPSFDGMPIPALGGGGGRSPGWSVFQVVMWTIFAGVVLVLAWQVARRLRFASDVAPQADAWRLGPWPVQLSQITTQAEYIKAFEYLALLLFGREISTSNHHQIGNRLSAETALDDEKRRAVDYLTEQYEQAKYAPAEQPITAETRRQLQLIAGSNAS